MAQIIQYLQEYSLVVLGSFVFRSMIYLVAAATAFIVFWKLLSKKLEHRRIYKNNPTSKQIRSEIFGSIRTLFIWALMTIPAYYLMVNEYSPNKVGALDPWYVNLLWLVALIVIHDAYFYWMHRLMHHPKIFRTFHSYHHKSINPTPWAIFSFDAAEAFIHFSIGYFFLLLFPCHILVSVAWFGLMVTYNIMGHLGFELYPKWSAEHKVLGMMNTPTHHAIHHKNFSCHYGLYFTFWDRLMGTEHADYHEIYRDVHKGQRI